ncbi:hypothetical protein EG834_17455, partial [bacterium]|nr:hypothetical protein [bacterium]
MTESPVIIRRSSGKTIAASKEFSFKPELIDDGSFYQQYRQKAWAAYQSLPFPTVRDEAWRWTDISKMPVESFTITSDNHVDRIPAELLEPVADAAHGGEILLAGEHNQIHLDPELANAGVIFTDIKDGILLHPEIAEMILGKVIDPKEDKFSALAGAMAANGVMLYVPKGLQVSTPLHSLLWMSGEKEAAFSHLLVYLDEGSSATYVHESSSLTEASAPGFHAGVMEIYVGTGAHLRFVELQSFGENIWNFMHERVRVDGDGEVE